MHGLLTTAQAAEKLGVTAGRVRQLIVDGRLPVTKLGRDNLIREVDLDLVKDRKPGRQPQHKLSSLKKRGSKKKRKA